MIFIVLGERGYGYKDSVLHRIVPGYIVQGGDFTSRDGNGQMSIYGGGGLFEDENFLVPHDSPGDDLYSDARARRLAATANAAKPFGSLCKLTIKNATRVVTDAACRLASATLRLSLS